MVGETPAALVESLCKKDMNSWISVIMAARVVEC